MITCKDFFNNETLNIFTDASVKSMGNNYDSCAGAIPYTGNEGIPVSLNDIQLLVQGDSTNNNGEITAILLAIRLALKYRYQYKTINIFSDSEISIKGIRDWIYSWVKNSKDGILYSTSGPVKNQNVFMEAIYTIISNRLGVNFYHQKGHVGHSSGDLYKAKNCFSRSNNIREDIDMEFISIISSINDDVDNITRNTLYDSDIARTKPLMEYFYNGFDLNLYRSLVNSK